LREELIFLLNQASELEHSLCCSYLFTAFSLKSGPGSGLSGYPAEAVERWRRTFRSVAVEEMMHLAIVNQLLVSVGSAPNFDRSNFPHSGSYYMPDLHIELEPFSEDLLRHFIAVEQPTGGTMPLRLNPELVMRIEGDLNNEIGPDPYKLASQGDIYGVILDGLKILCERLGEERVFIGPPPTQAFHDFLAYEDWEPIRDLASAGRALSRVIEQGEGGVADSVDSHYAQFCTVLDEYLALRESDPGFEPAWPVLPNPFTRTPPEASGIVNLIDDEFAIQVSDLFNEVYGAMLQLLARFFVTTTETEEEAAALESASIQLMTGAITPLGDLLTRLPAGSNHPGKNAGPSFVVHTLHPLPYKDAAWALLQERIGELHDYTARLSWSSEAASATVELASVAEALDKIVGLLRTADTRTN
jgi:hypothetical protein